MSRKKHDAAKEMVKHIRKLHHIANFDSFKKNRRHDLTDSQRNLLRELQESGQLSSAKLSRRLYVTPANITGIIDRLEKKQLVKRIQTKSDRRISYITMTQKGDNLIKNISDPMEEKLLSSFENITINAIGQLTESLKTIIHLLETENTKKFPRVPDT